MCLMKFLYCHFIIKEIANEFQGRFGHLWENAEKYKSFSVSIEKEVTNLVIKIINQSLMKN